MTRAEHKSCFSRAALAQAASKNKTVDLGMRPIVESINFLATPYTSQSLPSTMSSKKKHLLLVPAASETVDVKPSKKLGKSLGGEWGETVRISALCNI